MTNFVKVARKSDVPTRGGKKVRLGEDDIALFSIEGEILAVTNVCPHQHFSMLHEGELVGSSVTCPMHGKNFDLRTGISTNFGGRLKTFRVKVEGDDIWVELTKESRR